MKALLLLPVMLGLLSAPILLDRNDAAADHYRFIPDALNDEGKSYETYAWHNWVVSGEPIEWCYELTGTAAQQAHLAVGDWANVVNFPWGYEFQYVGTGDHCKNDGLYFKYFDPDEDLCLCFIPHVLHWDSARGGYYIKGATITVPTDIGTTHTTTGERTYMAHELGHAFALADHYDHGTGLCNQAPPVTIVDASFENSNGLVHIGCDGIYYPNDPTDGVEARDFYKNGFHHCCPVSEPMTQDSMLTYWDDESPAEHAYDVKGFYHDWWTGNPQWVHYSWKVKLNVARGDPWQPQTLLETLEASGNTWVYGTWYQQCVDVWHATGGGTSAPSGYEQCGEPIHWLVYEGQ